MVTPISLDHTDLLGDTTEEIAYEKAGIIKPGGFLVSAAQPVGAAQVLLEKAREVQAPYRFEGVEFGVESRTVAVGGQVVTIQGLAGRYEELLVPAARSPPGGERRRRHCCARGVLRRGEGA